MTEHTANIKIDPREIPYRIYSDYLVHIMFPNVDKKKILNNLQVSIAQARRSLFVTQQFTSKHSSSSQKSVCNSTIYK